MEKLIEELVAWHREPSMVPSQDVADLKIGLGDHFAKGLMDILLWLRRQHVYHHRRPLDTLPMCPWRTALRELVRSNERLASWLRVDAYSIQWADSISEERRAAVTKYVAENLQIEIDMMVDVSPA